MVNPIIWNKYDVTSDSRIIIEPTPFYNVLTVTPNLGTLLLLGVWCARPHYRLWEHKRQSKGWAFARMYLDCDCKPTTCRSVLEDGIGLVGFWLLCWWLAKYFLLFFCYDAITKHLILLLFTSSNLNTAVVKKVVYPLSDSTMLLRFSRQGYRKHAR